MRYRDRNMTPLVSLIVGCVLIMAPKSQAQLEIFEGNNSNKCLATVGEAPRCVQEVISSIFSLQLRFIGPTCCKALLDVEENCWRQVFPLVAASIPSLLRSFCTTSTSPQLIQVTSVPSTVAPTAGRILTINFLICLSSFNT